MPVESKSPANSGIKTKTIHMIKLKKSSNIKAP